MSTAGELETKHAPAIDAPKPRRQGERSLRRWLSEINGRSPFDLFHRRAGYIYRYDVAAAKASDCDDRAGWKIRRLTDEELAQTTSWNVAEQFIQRRRAAGDECYGVVIGSEVVYLHWLTANTCYVRGADLLIGLGPMDRYYYNIIVKPTFRGKGVCRLAQQQFLSFAADEGIGRLIAYIDKNNHISRHLTEQLGFELAATVSSFRALGRRVGNYYDAATNTVSRRLLNESEQNHYWI